MLDPDVAPGVRLRIPQASDADELHALIDVNRERLARWLPWAERQTRADTVAFIHAVRAQRAAGDGTQTAIEVDGALAGMIGLHTVLRTHGTTSVGYWLGEAYEGRGIMTAALGAYVEYAFSDLRLHRVELRAAVDNTRSRAVAERLGFVAEGLLRQAETVGDRRLDIVLYALLDD